MAEETRRYFFEFPNSIRQFGGSRSILFAGVAFIFIGLSCLVNGTAGLAFGGVKRFGQVVFFNQHWINVSYLLTGIAIVLAERKKINFMLFLAVSMTIMSLCLSIGVSISDCLNLKSMSGLRSKQKAWYSDYSDANISAAIAYNGVDFLCNILAFGTAIYTIYKLYNMSARYFAQFGTKSYKTLIAGSTILILATLNLVTHLLEASRNFLYVNYTMDQPFWLLVTMATGAVVATSAVTGSRVLTHIGLFLCFACYIPTISYLAFEYRWLSHYVLVKKAFLSDVHVTTTKFGISLNVLTIFALFITVVLLANRLPDEKNPWFELNRTYSSNVKNQFVCIPVLLIALGGMLIVIDIANSEEGSIYRYFMASDQKLPFVLIPTALVTLALNTNNTIACFLFPLTFALSITGLEHALRNLKAFLYISNNLYFPDQICDMLFVPKTSCLNVVQSKAVISHFFECFLSTIAMGLLIYLSAVIGRLMGLYGFKMDPNFVSIGQSRNIRCQIIALRSLGGVSALLGLIAILLTGIAAHLYVHAGTSSLIVLQDYVMFPAYYVTQTSLGLCQLLWSTDDMTKYPLRTIAIMFLSAIRIIQIFIIVDYRTVNGVSKNLAIILVGEFASIGLAFASLIICGVMLSDSTSQLPTFDFQEEMDHEDAQGYDWSQEMDDIDTNGFSPTGVLDMRND